MAKGRPRKPAKVLEMSGAARKNPQRYRARLKAEARPQPGLGDPPAEWTKDEAINLRYAHLLRIWRQIVAQDRVLKVLNCSHWLLVKNLCLLQYKVERANDGYGKATSGDYAQIKSSLAAIGQTPVDSARVAEAVRLPERETGQPSRANPGAWGSLIG